MEDAFRRVVEQIFSNWTALKLAVEHSQGGPDSKNVAIYCIDYTTHYCLNKLNVDVEDIQIFLEEVMDEQFNTVCEDNSIQEISTILYRFLVLVKAGNVTQYDREFVLLPKADEWLVKTRSVPVFEMPPEAPADAAPAAVATEAPADATAPTDATSQGESSNTPKPMEEDSEWTEVKSRKKK